MASGGRDTDGSDEDILRPVVKSKRKCKKMILSSESEDDSDFEVKRRKRVKPLQCESEDIDHSDNEIKDFDSDKIFRTEVSTDPSDNEQSEKCAICLSKFSGQDIATPEACDHVFCLECLQEWAKNVNTCPIDRLKFNLILIRHHKEEKIIKTIFVNNSELPYNSELESESNTESQVNYCELCGEDENEGSLLLCHECQKCYHYGCIIPTLHNSHSGSWQCPTCDNYIRIRDKFLLDVHRMLQGIKRRVRETRAVHRGRTNHSAMAQALCSQHSSTREFSRVRQRFLYQKSLLRSILSSSDSSDEEIERRSVSSRLYQNQVASTGSKTRCPLMSTKRRNELCRARNQRLVSSATAAATNSQGLYAADSDEGYSDFRLSSPPESENFDIVGSILQSQTLLHRPDVLTLSRDGSLLQNSKNGRTQSFFNLDTSSHSSESHNESSSLFSNNSASPYINNAVGKQMPLHSTQNNSSKYGETPRQNYTCSSSSAPRERSLSYDECILSGSAFGSGSNERFNNDPSSPMSQKSFCCTSTSDDMKKTASSNKDSNKGHHSEEEVDIYSDIESVGEEDNSLSDKVEPMKLTYKCEESQLSDTNDVSDSDNELVIDEDMPAEEEIEKLKDFNYSKNDDPIPENDGGVTSEGVNDCCQVGTENDYSPSPFAVKKYDNYNPSNFCSKQASLIAKDIGGDSQLENTQKSESNSDEAQESDVDMQDDENSLDSTRKSYQGCGSTSCSVKSSPKSLTHCENSASNENEFCENSCLETDSVKPVAEEVSNHENDNTNDSESQMEVENNSNKSDYVSQIEEPYKHKKYNFSVASEQIRVVHLDSNENSQNDANSNSSFAQSPQNNERIESEESAVSRSENSHFSFANSRENANRNEPEICEDSNDSNCADSQTENSGSFENNQKNVVQSELEECMDSNENSQNEPHSNLSSSKYEQNADGSEGEELLGSNENTRNENNSHFGFAGEQQNVECSDAEDLADSNPMPSKGPVTSSVTTETINISNDEIMKSENEEEDCDSFEDASTPCLDENLDGEIENSPIRNVSFDNANQDFSRTPDYEYETDTCPSKTDQSAGAKEKQLVEVEESKKLDNSVDLGIEDISEAGSEDLDEFPEDNIKSSHSTAIDDGCAQHALEASHKFFSPSHLSQSFEDQEEGEIIEDKPTRVNDKKCSKHDRYYDDSAEYAEQAPRMSISDLPRIPKLKRNKEKSKLPEPPAFDNKRTSVLSRVDHLGAGDVSWKRLSKHTRERSYRDGRPKDERLLYRERESRNNDKKGSDGGRRTDSKNSERRRDEKKKNSDKSKSESRTRKSDNKNKEIDWDYSEREKRKSHKEKHSKEKHSKDKKDKHEKTRYSKEETKYEREKTKEEVRYERETRYDKEERFERVIYEKGKAKEKEHKSKRRDRKSDSNKSSKDHSREKHKHVHSADNFTDKQREREVRKIDDKLKIVVEQKERKEKSNNKDRKEANYDKELHQRKRENERNSYSEMTSIESKEIFAKGDSIIINVSFNRTSSPKDISSTDVADVSSDQKLSMEEFEQDGNITEDVKSMSKNIADKKTTLDCLSLKRPVTPPERPIQVLSVSEGYWQGRDDPDGNNSVTSDKSGEGTHLEDENDTMESADDALNFSSSSSSTDAPATTVVVKEGVLELDVKSSAPEEKVDSFAEKDTFVPKRRSPRSPSPPSPADNDSYDPCEPTRSPSPPPPIPVAPPLPLSNPKPPPSPELPPLPPEPEPIDATHEDILQNQSEFNISSAVVSSATQPVTVETQTPSSLAFTGMLLPPPSFMSSTSNSLPSISSLLPPRTMSFQVSNSNVMAPNHMPQVMGSNFQMHGGSTLPPPPNPPNMPHMTSVPPPPPPPSAMALISQVRHPQLNVQPPLPPNSLLQNLSMAHGLSIPQLQLPPLPHLPPSLCAALANHQSPLTYTSQNQPTSLPVNIANQQGSRIMLAPNPISLMQNISNNNKPHVMSITQMLSHCQAIPVSSMQKLELPSKPSTPAEKNEVVDMDVDSPYSPGDCSVDSVNDYSPTGSPLPSTPKSGGDIFDTLFSADVRTFEKRTHDSSTLRGSKSRFKSANETPSKKSKHDHKGDSKVRHSVRMQLEKNKKTRKEQKLAEKMSKLEDSQLKILDELPSSAVEMQVKEKFLKKLNRQERVIEEVKLSLKPYYKTRDVNKEEYKDILRRAVPKICHNKTGEINPVKVKYLVECYVKKAKHSRKRGDKRKSKFS